MTSLSWKSKKTAANRPSQPEGQFYSRKERGCFYRLTQRSCGLSARPGQRRQSVKYAFFFSAVRQQKGERRCSLGVSITVDGIPVTAEEGTSVLKAALQAGIYIPHICSHPDPESIGACKLCVVEIECLCNAVIVATGGIGNNVDMICKYMGWKWGRDMFTFRIPGIDGLNMAWKIGAKQAKINMEVTYNTPGTTDIFKTLSETMRQPNLMVNLQGKRFINEEIMDNITYTGNALLQQKHHTGFHHVLCDQFRTNRRHGGCGLHGFR